ncbi:class I SAM-dependent methyltransferase [Halalkalibacter alkalisediminis]|uniref:SAM-dependent methyltransferase n=1 Tax=Halalkalibacter alkalisediminis TaxID=935616 RepID=A0ABV6NA23_9BACI|nr:class I SAM-dependent methyltransferase [Halalkalibacter alkalisediminis]
MKDQDYDKLLNIETGEDGKELHISWHYNRYEPTPYRALETLFSQYELKNSDRIVDFGCGKGRLNFFIHDRFHASVVGIEVDEMLYLEAIENQKSYVPSWNKGKENILFLCCKAEEYQINESDNQFYFFNPFSIQVFRRVINRILRSVETHAREIELVLYYPTKDYIHFLENDTSFELKKEVIIPDLYEKNQNERFLIYQLNY